MINNFKTVAKVTIALGVLLLMTVVFLIFALTDRVFQKIYLIIALISFIFYLILLLKRMYFFSVEKKSDEIIVRFYNPHPLLQNYKQIKIKINEFEDYEIYGNKFRRYIVFKIRKGNQQGKYPPVSITALSKEQLSELRELLDGIKQDK